MGITFMNNPTKWEYYPHLAEFAYNNGYHTFAKMSPFEVLYGRKSLENRLHGIAQWVGSC